MKIIPKKTDEEIEERIRKVNGAMALEGMPLTKEEKEMLKKCHLGITTTEKERQRILSECRQIYG